MTPPGANDRSDELDELLRLISSQGARLDDPEVQRAIERFYGRRDMLELLGDVVREERLLQLLHLRTGIGSAGESDPRTDAQASVLSVRPLDNRARGSARSTRWKMVPLAAAAALVMGVVLNWSALSSFMNSIGGTPPTTQHVVATGAAELDTVRLPDGSRTILAPNSTIRYVIAPAVGEREVWLEGEAYFDVEHDAERPFRVRTRRAVVEDLGTSFVVREYAEDSRARVAVRSGAAVLHASDGSSASPIDLRPGDGAYIDSTGAIARFTGDPESFGAWTGGYLAFDGASLPEVLAQLAAWYDVEFRMNDPVLAKQHFTGGLNSTSLSKALEILGPIVHARFAQEGRVVAVTARPDGH